MLACIGFQAKILEIGMPDEDGLINLPLERSKEFPTQVAWQA